jgi:hypothetical protein
VGRVGGDFQILGKDGSGKGGTVMRGMTRFFTNSAAQKNKEFKELQREAEHIAQLEKSARRKMDDAVRREGEACSLLYKSYAIDKAIAISHVQVGIDVMTLAREIHAWMNEGKKSSE